MLSGGQKLTPAVSARGTNMSHKMAWHRVDGMLSTL